MLYAITWCSGKRKKETSSSHSLHLLLTQIEIVNSDPFHRIKDFFCVFLRITFVSPASIISMCFRSELLTLPSPWDTWNGLYHQEGAVYRTLIGRWIPCTEYLRRSKLLQHLRPSQKTKIVAF